MEDLLTKGLRLFIDISPIMNNICLNGRPVNKGIETKPLIFRNIINKKPGLNGRPVNKGIETYVSQYSWREPGMGLNGRPVNKGIETSKKILKRKIKRARV